MAQKDKTSKPESALAYTVGGAEFDPGSNFRLLHRHSALETKTFAQLDWAVFWACVRIEQTSICYLGH